MSQTYLCNPTVLLIYRIQVVLKRHYNYTESYACAKDAGKVVSGSFPEGIASSLQYGSGIKALAATLNTEGMMSVSRIHEFLSAALGPPVCAGKISAMVKELASQVGGTVRAVFQSLLVSPVNNADETGFRVEGGLYWLHSVCNEDFTYLAVQKKRGEEGMRAIGFLPKYEGVVVSDCFRSYWKFPNLSHALCNAHILRELKGLCENDPKQAWAEDLRSLLRAMAHARNEALRSGASALPPKTFDLCGEGKNDSASSRLHFSYGPASDGISSHAWNLSMRIRDSSAKYTRSIFEGLLTALASPCR